MTITEDPPMDTDKILATHDFGGEERNAYADTDERWCRRCLGNAQLIADTATVCPSSVEAHE